MRGGSFLIVVALSPFAAAVAAGQTAAQPAGVDLTWSAPAGCPTREEVLGETNLILGATPPRAVEARASVIRVDGRWKVDLTIRSDQETGERTLEASSCPELASAVALIVALAVDPSRKPPPAVAPEEAGAPPSPTTPVSAQPPADSDGVRLSLGADGALDVGALPRPALGATVSIGALYRRVRLDARANVWGTQHAVDPSSPSQGAAFDLATIGGRGCYAALAEGAPARAGWAVFTCLGLSGSRVSGAGYGAAPPTTVLSNDGSWMSAEVAALGTWALGGTLALRADAALLLPLSRPAFVVLAPDRHSIFETLHQPSLIGGRVGVGAEVRFF